ncbi:MAG: peptide-methionine (S)-S-oxide reductase MsrA [Bacteroidetes bacterium]|nr:peptide-methionine (S)-S-oxide reductase MsrA [Bacteroidota bacterium]
MKTFAISLLTVWAAFSACAQNKQKPAPVTKIETEKSMQTNEGLATATFGAGCFWCVEAIFQDLKGVESVASGYSGGQVKNPTYREVCNGTTGHAEVLQIKYDPAVIPFENLVKVFFTTHDPTTLNRQGADAGTQYRSAIFYHDEAQKTVAERMKKEFAPTLWDDPIVTEISPFTEFYKAEDYHQNYFKDNPNEGYCRIVINPKVQKFRKLYADWLKE